MITIKDIKDMYDLQDQPVVLSTLEKDEIFTTFTDFIHFYTVLAQTSIDVAVKTVGEKSISYYCFPKHMMVNSWKLKKHKVH